MNAIYAVQEYFMSFIPPFPSKSTESLEDYDTEIEWFGVTIFRNAWYGDVNLFLFYGLISTFVMISIIRIL